MLVITIFFCHLLPLVSLFSPDTSSFDAYGIKLAVNDLLLVECFPSQSTFLLRLAPYNYSLSCTLPYNNSDDYIYTVAVARHATNNDTIQFVFVGLNTETDIPFIGSLKYTGVAGDVYIATQKQTRKIRFPCDGWNTSNYQIHYLQQFSSANADHTINNDFFVVIVSPMGDYAYGFTQNFLVVYDLNNNTISIQLGNKTWPDSSFLPHAVDMTADDLFVIVGYVGDSDTQYTPCAYLLNIINATVNVLDTWSYTAPTNNSWQATLTNWDADVYSAKYDMSVSINDDADEVLLGIQIVNTMILIDINRISNTFGLSPRTLSNGKAIGMGKAVGWLESSLAVVLVNTYSFSYVWSSSQIVVYNISDPDSFVVVAVFPNSQQTFVPILGPELLFFAITADGTMVILDTDGDYYTLIPSPPGSASDSSTGSSSMSKLCMAGTYSSKYGVLPCLLCPTGTTTNGLTGQLSCTECQNDSFCPLGAAFGNLSSSSSIFSNIQQVYAYPISPQSTRFDNILIQNILTIRTSSRHCLVVSPLFWALIAIAIGVAIWLSMFLLKYYTKTPRGIKTRQYVKSFFKKTDLIGEGEMVIGGLFSFAIIILIGFAYTFSYDYFRRYPIEEIHDSATFACDPTLSNSQFSSGLMSTAISPNDLQSPMFALLDEQELTLYVDFVNTQFTCVDVSAVQVKDTDLDLSIASCNESDTSLSVSIILPAHSLTIKITLADTNIIGGLRMRLEGSGNEEENEALEATYKLSYLDFAQTFSVSGRLLTQEPSCTLQLTKIINQTYPLSEDGTTRFNAIWLPSLTTDLDEMFLNENEYLYATSSNKILSIVINEAPYYMLNTQKPITDEAELIFTNILFTIVCLEIFGFGFLLFKLVLLPLLHHLINCYHRKVHKNNASHMELGEPSPSSTCRL